MKKIIIIIIALLLLMSMIIYFGAIPYSLLTGLDNNIVVAILAAFVAMTGWLVNDILSKQRELRNQLYIEKKKLFEDFCEYLCIAPTFFGDNTPHGKRKQKTFLKRLETYFIPKIATWAGPEMIKSFQNFKSYDFNSKSKYHTVAMFSLVGQMIAVMRKELGLPYMDPFVVFITILNGNDYPALKKMYFEYKIFCGLKYITDIIKYPFVLLFRILISFYGIANHLNTSFSKWKTKKELIQDMT